ncbi:hypothetical protein [Nesterenkonia xinjiangensis]|uniref:Uncharacterized protein n=1 Tax=Nesterenkonia xinjiangensis TaxID=225327 RepID=A0A7Z0GJ87_9MICC|nr:hypothetical protein [Nesterenkonia xinjiangensis]NYJ77006.1 hypothetical protein [Nesterenkonia xinjiangensis]
MARTEALRVGAESAAETFFADGSRDAGRLLLDRAEIRALLGSVGALASPGTVTLLC